MFRASRHALFAAAIVFLSSSLLSTPARADSPSVAYDISMTQPTAHVFHVTMTVDGIDRTASSQFDAASYDIVLIYAAAMKTAKVTGDPANLASERSAIRDALRQMKDFPALEGAISFGKNGDALKPAFVIEMNDAKWNLIATYPPNS